MKKRDRISKKRAVRGARKIRLKHTRKLTPSQRAFRHLIMPSFFGWANTFQFEPRWRLIKRMEASK